jgi:hypothetical protein
MDKTPKSKDRVIAIPDSLFQTLLEYHGNQPMTKESWQIYSALLAVRNSSEISTLSNESHTMLV